MALINFGILLVDSCESALKMNSDLLRAEGAFVSEANCAADALEIYRRKRESIVVVITAARVRGADGYTIAKAIRAIGPAPVILLTDSIEDFDAAVGEGVSEFLVKPFTSVELRYCLQRCLFQRWLFTR